MSKHSCSNPEVLPRLLVVSKLVMSARAVVIIGLVLGGGCVIGGIDACTPEPRERTGSGEGMGMDGGAFGWLIGVPLVLVGALILSVTLAYAVTRPKPGAKTVEEALRAPPPKLPVASVVAQSKPRAEPEPEPGADPPWVRELSKRDKPDPDS
jgi:hypothetical protein